MGWEKGVMFVNLDGESLFEGLVNIDSNHDELLIGVSHLSNSDLYSEAQINRNGQQYPMLMHLNSIRTMHSMIF